MWKCIRCERENLDSAEKCVNCGHGRTMDYTGHRVLSKIRPEIEDNWKQNDPDVLKIQAGKYLLKAESLLKIAGEDSLAKKIREMMIEVTAEAIVNRCEKLNVLNGANPSKVERNSNIWIVENHHLTEQNAKQNTSAFRYGGENVLGGKESPNIRIVENRHLTEQNTSAFRYGGENVLGGDTIL